MSMRLILLLMQLQLLYHSAHCLEIRFASAAEEAVRTWRVRLHAQFSDRASCLAVLFRTMPHHLDIGAYEFTLTSIGNGWSNVGPVNVTWERVRHFPDLADNATGGGFSLLMVPLRGVFLGSKAVYKLHLMPLMFRNGSEINSIAATSQLFDNCYIIFRPGVQLPPRPPLSADADCLTGRLPLANLTARLEPQLGLRLTDDGCCLERLQGEAAASDSSLGGDSTGAAAAANAAALSTAAVATGASAAILAACCALLVVRAARHWRRPRVLVLPSGAPYSTLAAHCRSVYTNEPLMHQGMAFRFYLVRADLRSFCGYLLRIQGRGEEEGDSSPVLRT